METTKWRSAKAILNLEQAGKSRRSRVNPPRTSRFVQRDGVWKFLQPQQRYPRRGGGWGQRQLFGLQRRRRIAKFFRGRYRWLSGGNLTFTNGQVANGSAEVGGTVHTSQFGIPHGTVLSGQYLNFSADQTQLDKISSTMAATAHNGTVTNYYGNFTLTGKSSGTNVFDLTAAQLANCHGMTIKAPAGSSVIINVSGANVSMQNFGINLSGVSASNVVWNFDQAKSLTMSSIGVQGNVLAPHASVQFNNGQINGTLVAENFCGTGQLNWVPPPAYCNTSSIAGSVCTTCGDSAPTGPAQA